MPLLPEVWAIGIMPSSASLAATISAARALSTMVMPGPGIQIDDHTIGQRLAGRVAPLPGRLTMPSTGWRC